MATGSASGAATGSRCRRGCASDRRPCSLASVGWSSSRAVPTPRRACSAVGCSIDRALRPRCAMSCARAWRCPKTSRSARAISPQGSGGLPDAAASRRPPGLRRRRAGQRSRWAAAPSRRAASVSSTSASSARARDGRRRPQGRPASSTARPKAARAATTTRRRKLFIGDASSVRPLRRRNVVSERGEG